MTTNIGGSVLSPIPKLSPPAPKEIVFTSEEAQLVVQLLERAQAQNKDMVALKNGIVAKLIPLLPDDPPAPVAPMPMPGPHR